MLDIGPITWDYIAAGGMTFCFVIGIRLGWILHSRKEKDGIRNNSS